MKRIALTLFLLAILYGAGFVFGRSRAARLERASTQLPVFVDNGFRPTSYPLEYRSFVIVMIAHNNGAFIEKSLASIFSQHYPHYRMIYIDDGSTDGSASLAGDLIASSGQKELVTFIRHPEQSGELAHLSSIVREIDDQDIVVWLGGKDQLAHVWALTHLNAYYVNPELWLTYGQYLEMPGYRLGKSAPFERAEWETKGFRGHPFVSSHLKTFYAGLFQQIDPADFTYQGAFLSSAVEEAVMIPLLELAKDHFQFIPDVLCLAHKGPLSVEEMELFLRAERYVRSLASYEPLPFLFSRGFIDE